MSPAAPAFALARFAFWIQTALSHALFHLVRRIEAYSAAAKLSLPIFSRLH